VKLLTLFRPATGELRAEPVDRGTNEILHPWLKEQLTAILQTCPLPPSEVRVGCRWADWDWREEGCHRDETLPPLRMLLIWDNLKGHHTAEMVQWCLERGIGPLYTPLSGSWLNMAESIQRIIQRRALEGQDPQANAAVMKDWLRGVIHGWNCYPTPFTWGGKRRARRDRAYARRHRLGGSGATTSRSIRRRDRSVCRFHGQSVGKTPGK